MRVLINNDIDMDKFTPKDY